MFAKQPKVPTLAAHSTHFGSALASAEREPGLWWMPEQVHVQPLLICRLFAKLRDLPGDRC